MKGFLSPVLCTFLFQSLAEKGVMKKHDYDIQTILHGFHSYLAGQKRKAQLQTSRLASRYLYRRKH